MFSCVDTWCIDYIHPHSFHLPSTLCPGPSNQYSAFKLIFSYHFPYVEKNI